MGKKSKRSRNKSGNSNAPTKPPALRTPVEETKDNLQFEDPFIDEAIVEEEEDIVEEQTNVEEKEQGIQVWNPYSTNTAVKLEMDESAYLMHHALSVEWPSLSFDFIRDSLGEARTRFPHILYCVAGTQAPSHNKIQLLKLSDLDKIRHETEDDVLGEEYDKPDDDSSSSSDEESVDLDPILESFEYSHSGGSNRVRVQPHSTIVSSWSDDGNVYLYDVEPLMNQCSGSSNTSTTNTKQPFFTYSGHSNEGFAMDWSHVDKQHLATGDVDGNIHIWQQTNTHEYSVTPMYESEHSVEDLQWSPTESTVLAACTCQGFVNIYDTRAPHRSMISNRLSSVDINVMSWNSLVGNLLSTGDDNGVVSVWDLRNFQKSKPLARFTSHQTPITSLEWHPTDESMLAVTDDVGAYVYDLSVEEEYATSGESEGIPPQLLFCHKGSELFKEVHWHPQISSCLMTTALSGFSVFIPSNL
jgi:ribosome assembly protein RRB1